MQVWGVYLRKVQFGAVGACQGSWGICVWHEHLLLELAADGQGRAGQGRLGDRGLSCRCISKIG